MNKKYWKKNEHGAYILYIELEGAEPTEIIGFYPEKTKDGMYKCTFSSVILEIEHDYEWFDTLEEAKETLEEKAIELFGDQIEFLENVLSCLEAEGDTNGGI